MENNEITIPTVITKIQLTTETPYKLICVYSFLYKPADDSRLIIDDKEYMLNDMIDMINSKGNITRYLQYGY